MFSKRVINEGNPGPGPGGEADRAAVFPSLALRSHESREVSAADRTEAARLCREALHGPDQAAALRALRENARLVLWLLAEDEVCDALTIDPPGSVCADRIAAVYQALAHAEPEPDLPVSTREALLRDNLEEEAAIGRAFKEDLLALLRPALRNLIVFFAAAPRVSRKVREHLRRTPCVDAAWPECAGLVECGLTPLSVFFATSNVADLAERLEMGDRPVPLVRVRGAMSWQAPAREFSHRVTREILQVNRCSPQAAETLVDWLIEAAAERPLLFAGYRATRLYADHRAAHVYGGRRAVSDDAGHPPARTEVGVGLVTDDDYSGKTFAERWRDAGVAEPVEADFGSGMYVTC
jgi:hypothetical protein